MRTKTIRSYGYKIGAISFFIAAACYFVTFMIMKLQGNLFDSGMLLMGNSLLLMGNLMNLRRIQLEKLECEAALAKQSSWSEEIHG